MEKIEVDPETKITEYDYENYIHKGVLKDIDTSSESFKELIKMLNFISKTELE